MAPPTQGFPINQAGVQRRFIMLQSMMEKLSWLSLFMEDYNSTHWEERYPGLGTPMPMQEWIGPREIDQPADYEFAISNVLYQNAVQIPHSLRLLGDPGIAMMHIDRYLRQLAWRRETHKMALFIALLEAAETTNTWDGQTFFSPTHESRKSGVQSNDISRNITATPSAPTADDCVDALQDCIEADMKRKDDWGEPMDDASTAEYTALVPVNLIAPMSEALGSQIIIDKSGTGMKTNPLVSFRGGYKIRLQASPRLSWTTKFAFTRTDPGEGAIRPFIHQEVSALGPQKVAILGDDTTWEFFNNSWLVGQKAYRGTGYAAWQLITLFTFT